MNNYRLAYSIPSLLLALCFMACGNGNGRLSRDKMVDVMHDLQLVEAIYQTRYEDFNKADNKTALLEGVFQKHGITQAQLDSSLVWYADHPEEYMKVTDSVSARLKRESKELDDKVPNYQKIQAFNHSILPYYTYLTEANTFLDFDIDSIKSKDFSNFEISLRALGIHSRMKAELAVHFQYEDTTITRFQEFTDDLIPKITNPVTSDSIKEISGYIHINAPMMTDYKVLLYDIKLKNTDDLKQKSAADTTKVDTTPKVQ